MTTPKLGRAGLLAATAALAACGGGSKTVLSPGANGLPYSVAGLSADAVTMASTYAGIAFTGDSGSAAWQDNGGVTAIAAGTGEKNVSITVIDGSNIDVNTGSGTVRMVRQIGTTSVGGITGDLWQNASGSLQGIFALAGDAGNPTTINSIFFGYIAQAEVTGPVTDYSDTFIMSGFETTPGQVTAALPTATYTGPAGFYMRQADGTVGTRLRLIENPSGTNVTANFGTGAVTGTISGLAGGADNALGTGQVVLTVNGTITGNGFDNAITGFTSNAALTLNGAQNIRGNFYGQNAAEMGGVISTGISNATAGVATDTLASGFFLGE